MKLVYVLGWGAEDLLFYCVLALEGGKTARGPYKVRTSHTRAGFTRVFDGIRYISTRRARRLCGFLVWFRGSSGAPLVQHEFFGNYTRGEASGSRHRGLLNLPPLQPLGSLLHGSGAQTQPAEGRSGLAEDVRNFLGCAAADHPADCLLR